MDNRKNNTKSHHQAIKLFIDRILDDPAWPKLLRALRGPNARAVPKSPPLKIKSNKEKASVKIALGANRRPLLVRIKTFKGNSAGNQLERCNQREFYGRYKLRRGRKLLKPLWLRKAANPKRRLVAGKDNCQRVAELFDLFDPKTALLGYDKCPQTHPQVLALYNSLEDYWHLYSMTRDVLQRVQKQKVGFTPRGNILIGKYIVIQRRGKEGKWGTSRGD